MKRFNELILIMLLISMLVIGGYNLAKTILDVEFEIGYSIITIFIMIVSCFIFFTLPGRTKDT